jgi:thiamine kinase-like enzyme
MPSTGWHRPPPATWSPCSVTIPNRSSDVLAAQNQTLIHGDLKLANVGIAADGAIEIVDWQMVSIAPIAIEIGWFLVSNVASLPVEPEDVLFRYQRHLADGALDPDDGRLERTDFGRVGGRCGRPGRAAAPRLGGRAQTRRPASSTRPASARPTISPGWCQRAVEAAARLL